MIDDVIGSWIPELVYLIEVAFPHNAGRNMCLLESHWDSGLETVLYGVSADLLGAMEQMRRLPNCLGQTCFVVDAANKMQ